MTSQAVRLASLIAAISFWSVVGTTAWAEESDTAALAAAMKNAKATLQRGLRASKAQGTPISAKFEIEDGKLQLKMYTMRGDAFMAVVADPKTGAIAKAEEITDAMDLSAAIEQKAAMEKATVPLLTAAEAAVKANAGARAVSIVPKLKNGQATAEVTLLAHLQESYREPRLSRLAGRGLIVQLVAARLAGSSAHSLMAEVVSVSGSDLEVLRDTRDALARAFGDRLEARRTFCKLINVAGHRLGTKEIESASLLVEEVAEAAVVPARDEIKGRTPDLYVSLKPGLKASQEIRKRVEESVVREIGPIARPRRVMIVPDMPKTRSGKIMRRVLAAISNNEDAGDISTLANPEVVAEIQQMKS